MNETAKKRLDEGNVMPIAWHQECVASQRVYLDGLINQRATLNERIKMVESGICILQLQIDRAIELGKDGFDRDRFMVTQQ